MPEAEISNTVKGESSPPSPPRGKSHLIPIAVGAIVFVVFVLIFSLKYGVFSSSNVAQPATTTGGQAAAGDSAVPGERKGAEQDPYEGLFAGFDESNADGENEDTAAIRDSLSKVTWYETQKNEIMQQLGQLEMERAQLQGLKAEVQALLDHKKAMEEGNITQMAKLYEGMGTEELVPILANLTDAQVSILISKMKKQKASEVLGKLPPERAAKITQYIISMDTD